MKRILVKVGTNVLTRPNGRLDYNRISDLATQLAKIQKDIEVIFVSSGAVGAGREFREFSDEQDPIVRKQMLAAIGQGRLFQVYADFFREAGVLPAQALLTRKDFLSKTSYENIAASLEGLLRHKVLPIVNDNDVVSFRESSFSDNDQLAAMTAAMMQADLMIILSNINGFYTADPNINKDAKLIQEVDQISNELLELCEDSLSSGGTGGMLSKLKAAELAQAHGIPVIVTNGLKDEELLRSFEGKTSGTTFKAKKKRKLSRKGNWMVAGAAIKGTVVVDDGAVNALKQDKSLLAVGVREIQGDFLEKDVILVQTLEGIRIGAGLAGCSSSELKGLLKGNGKKQGVVVVHKNHLITYKDEQNES